MAATSVCSDALTKKVRVQAKSNSLMIWSTTFVRTLGLSKIITSDSNAFSQSLLTDARPRGIKVKRYNAESSQIASTKRKRGYFP